VFALELNFSSTHWSKQTQEENTAEGLLSYLIFAGLFYFMMRYGCGAHMIHGHGKHGSHSQGEVKHIDPVCGMEVEMDQGYGKMYEGQLYRFCSRNCLDKFEAEPESYLKQDNDDKGGET
jgi:YHS domain-containing protein